MPTPTTFLFFTQTDGPDSAATPDGTDSTGLPTVASLFTERDTPVPTATYTPFPTNAPLRPDFSSSDIITSTIFDDALNKNWIILEDTGTTFDTASQDRVHSGEYAISFTPEVDFGSLYFAVKPETDTAYPFNEVVGIDFWLNSGDDYLQLDELAVAVIGSNDYYYWVAGDNSVKFPAGETFSETRLYFLGLNRSIPPDTWVEVYLPLDSLIYDPEYRFVTGFYLKNDEGFLNTLYLDDVNFVMAAGSEATPIPTLAVTPAAGGTPAPETSEAITPTPDATSDGAAANCEISPPDGWIAYRIQSGDSIANLAFVAGASLESVLEANCLSSNSVLSVGKEIWLPTLPITATVPVSATLPITTTEPVTSTTTP
ncbi:MAG: hypothetical protein KC441_09090 [Anaerolineales bacterium]|nr:hypothetical protein [Anaerolineales bacterium]